MSNGLVFQPILSLGIHRGGIEVPKCITMKDAMLLLATKGQVTLMSARAVSCNQEETCYCLLLKGGLGNKK